MSTVTIGCKLPNGIYMIVGEKRIRIKGWNNNEIKGGSHGITEGVPQEVWEAWRKEHADSKLVKREIIFAVGDVKRAQDKAKDQAKNKSGHEQLPRPSKKDAAGALGESDER